MSGNRIPIKVLPPRILIDLFTDCNLKCPMCIVHGAPDSPELKGMLKKSMSYDKAKQILDEAQPAKPCIGPTLWSEPLMNKDILVHLKSMKMRDMKVSINTNGLLMNKKMSRSLVDIGVDSISVSIDATSPETLKRIRGVANLEKIVNNINQLLEIRGGNTSPRIGVSFTKQEGNLHEVNEFIEQWIKIVDFVRVGEVFEDGRFPSIELDRSERKPCPDLYTTMAIHNDGEVSICCLDGFKDHTVGNVFEEGVAGVWNGEKLNRVREYHETGQWDKVPFCKNCDRWASEQFVEEELDGLLIRKSPEFTFYNRIDRMNTWKK